MRTAVRTIMTATALGLLTFSAACQAPADGGTAGPAHTPTRVEKLATGPEAAVPEATVPEGPAMVPERVNISETPCRTAIGESASARLVQRCIAVSPATRPPCNALNPCDLIQGEIDRSCALFGDDPKPAECAA